MYHVGKIQTGWPTRKVYQIISEAKNTYMNHWQRYKHRSTWTTFAFQPLFPKLLLVDGDGGGAFNLFETCVFARLFACGLL